MSPEFNSASDRFPDYSKTPTAEIKELAWDPKNCDLDCLHRLLTVARIRAFSNDFDDVAAELILFLEDKIVMIESRTHAAAVMEMFLNPSADFSSEEQELYMMMREFEE